MSIIEGPESWFNRPEGAQVRAKEQEKKRKEVLRDARPELEALARATKIDELDADTLEALALELDVEGLHMRAHEPNIVGQLEWLASFRRQPPEIRGDWSSQLRQFKKSVRSL